jgi:tetratricopeptide (TPR) repeat protein
MAVYQRALTTNQNMTDPPELPTLTTLNNLANVYQRQDRLQDAETLLKEVVIRKELLYGDKSTSIFEQLMNLGHIYRVQGRFSEMEDMFRRALERAEATLGSEDQNTLAAAYELHSFYTQQGRSIDEPLRQKVELLKGMPGPPVPLYCDRCQKRISASITYYSCNTCNNNDFDICQHCVDKGLTCLDRTHKLVKGRF